MKINVQHLSRFREWVFPVRLHLQIGSRREGFKRPIFLTIQVLNQEFIVYVWRDWRDYTPIGEWIDGEYKKESGTTE